MVILRVIAILLFLTAPLLAQGEQHDLRRPGSYVQIVQDSVRLVAAQIDTTLGLVRVNGVDVVSYFALYHSRNDSINVVTYADFSPDGLHWYKSVALDTAVVSGTTDATEAKKLDPNTFPDWAIFARSRAVGAAAAGDTVDVKVWWVLHYLGEDRLR